MATILTQIRIEENLKKQASELPEYRREVIEAIEEAKVLSQNPNAKKYHSFSEAMEDLD